MLAAFALSFTRPDDKASDSSPKINGEFIDELTGELIPLLPAETGCVEDRAA